MFQDNFKIACQTFTWEMLGDGWTGGPDDLLKSISDAGYAGIEITDTMIGHYKDSPLAFSEALKAHDLTLVAFGFGSDSGFTTQSMIDRDLDRAQTWINFASQFPGALISLGSATVVSDGPREEKFEVAAQFYNKVAEIGLKVGVDVAIHPSSHHNTLLLSREDYDHLFAMLDAKNVGWVPDTGHIIRGHENLLDTLQCYQERIRYVHLKDVDDNGQWAMLGQGVCDIPNVLQIAREAPFFNGWVVSEEESEYAAQNPNKAVRENRLTLANMGY